ncbi:hypothetical protein [Haladaptatus sp. DYF46]|uniref:hypothetical protein n=1 Tax=Haladaptatus sp. DYF46 TaxID=2886041 RepID=UPI001E512762|nr:hypothetical protein [Haladaptatus sp. DYF46]
MGQNVNVIGLEKQNNRKANSASIGPTYDKHLVVEINGTEERIPVIGLHLSSFEYVSRQHDEPDPLSFDRVFVDDKTLHAEKWLSEDTVLELLHPSSGGLWEIHRIENAPKDRDFPTIWERSSSD